MRTTLNLDDELMRAVKQCALDTGRTITEVIEAAIREGLRHQQTSATSYRLQWPTVRGHRLPRMDLTDRDALYDHMEGRQ